MKKKTRKRIFIFVVIALILPIALNFILQIDIGCDNIIGDSKLWLTLWIEHFNSIISMGLLYFAYKTLKLSQQQMKNSMRIWQEDRRAYIKIDIIKQWDNNYYLRFRNIGHEDAYNIKIKVSGNIYEQLEEDTQEVISSISNTPFFIPAHETQLFRLENSSTFDERCNGYDYHLHIEGTYNNKYCLSEELVINEFIKKMSGNPDERFNTIAKIWFEHCIMNKHLPSDFSQMTRSINDIKNILEKDRASDVKEESVVENTLSEDQHEIRTCNKTGY